MTASSSPVIEDWTFANITKYYRANLDNNEHKNVLDCIKKDLVKVTKSSEFDKTRQRKAQTILNDWRVSSLFKLRLYKLRA